jgi:serine/threonine protein kinase
MQCLYILNNGTQCKNNGSKKPDQNYHYCWIHQPCKTLNPDQDIIAVPAKVKRAPIKLKPVIAPLSFDSFNIIKELGAGAFGTVSTARYKNDPDGQIFVIKKIPKIKTSKSTVMSEVNILKQLQPHCHDSILCYTKFFEDDDNYYILSEYLENYIELEEMIKRLKKMPATQRIEIVLSLSKLLVEGLKTIHSLDAAHRDIKPANIMVSIDGNHIKYIDFGVSCFLETCNTSGISGTPSYWAPELFRGGRFNLLDLQLADIWALGVTLYELCYQKRLLTYVLNKFTPEELNLYNVTTPSTKKYTVYFEILKKSHTDIINELADLKFMGLNLGNLFQMNPLSRKLDI